MEYVGVVCPTIHLVNRQGRVPLKLQTYIDHSGDELQQFKDSDCMFHVLGRLEDCKLASTAPTLVSSLVSAEILLTVTDKEQTLVFSCYLAITCCTAERAVTYTPFQFESRVFGSII
jgi:hypothetical protein